MKNTVDLLSLYTEVNTKVIEDGRNRQFLFKRCTSLLSEMIRLMSQIKIVIEQREYDYMRTTVPADFQLETIDQISLWTYFDLQNKLESTSVSN